MLDFYKVRVFVAWLCVPFCLTLLWQCKTNSQTNDLGIQSSQILILEHEFTIKKLQRKRTVRIYLPKNYNQTKKRFPVIYMHDAQNLFDSKTAYAGEWCVDEHLDSLHKSNLQAIVVGIDNGEEYRISELSIWNNTAYKTKAEGNAYLNFIVNAVKPKIDANFRTKIEAEHTIIAGSSLGALISHYALLKYSDVFGKAILFSPSYWFHPKINAYTQSHLPNPKQKIYLLAGAKEDEGKMVENAKNMHNILAKALNPKQLKLVIDQNGEHKESFWREYFDDALVWILSN